MQRSVASLEDRLRRPAGGPATTLRLSPGPSPLVPMTRTRRPGLGLQWQGLNFQARAHDSSPALKLETPHTRVPLSPALLLTQVHPPALSATSSNSTENPCRDAASSNPPRAPLLSPALPARRVPRAIGNDKLLGIHARAADGLQLSHAQRGERRLGGGRVIALPVSP